MSELSAKIVNLVNEIMESDEDIPIDESLEDSVGMASVDFIELFVGVEKITGINVPEDKFASLRSVKDVVNYVDERVNAQP